MPTQTCSRKQELTVRILLINIQTQGGAKITDGVLTIRQEFCGPLINTGLRIKATENNIHGVPGLNSWIEFEINDAINGLEENADVNDIDSMTGMQYENFCKSILVKAGWEVEDTPASGDQGVDLIASLDDMRVCIQCKRLKRKVGNGAVQEVAAGLQHYKGTHAVVVSNAGFTKAAERLAESTQVVLISEMELEELEDRL